MSDANLLSIFDKIKVDGNEVINQLTEVVEKVATDDTNAIVYNATDKSVEFYCYNDSDFLQWIPARHPKCPPASITYLNKGPLGWGLTIQVYVQMENEEGNLVKEGAFEVLRKHAYIWDGVKFWGKDEVAAELKSLSETEK